MVAAARILACLVLTLTLGLHWAVLQSVAWTGMLVRYSRNATIVEALQKTFDGKHPCSLCRFIQQGGQTGQDSSSERIAPHRAKLDPVPLEKSRWVCAAPAVAPLPVQSPPRPESFDPEPLTPPPRVVWKRGCSPTARLGD